MTFNAENKITYNELAPSLQALIDSKVSDDEYNRIKRMADELTAHIDSIRVSITKSTDNVPTPIADKEILLNTTDKAMYGYNNTGWYKCGGVYS